MTPLDLMNLFPEFCRENRNAGSFLLTIVTGKPDNPDAMDVSTGLYVRDGQHITGMILSGIEAGKDAAIRAGASEAEEKLNQLFEIARELLDTDKSGEGQAVY